MIKEFPLMLIRSKNHLSMLSSKCADCTMQNKDINILLLFFFCLWVWRMQENVLNIIKPILGFKVLELID